MVKSALYPFLPNGLLHRQDLHISVAKETPVANVIMDGHIMQENLRHTGNDETWLKKQLHAQGVSHVKDVFLATCDCNNTLEVYVKLKKKQKIFLNKKEAGFYMKTCFFYSTITEIRC